MWKRRVLKQQITMDCSDGSEEVELACQFVLICFKAAQFIELLEANNWQKFLDQVESKHPRFSLGLLVQDLEKFIKSYDNKKLNQSLHYQEGNFEKSLRDRVGVFLADLLVRYPGVRFREINNLAQGAEHVHALTVSIARQPYYQNQTVIHNFAGGKLNEGYRRVDVMCSDFTPGQKAWAKSLYMVEGIGPNEVVTIVKEYKSMRELMEQYLNPNLDDKSKSLLLENLLMDSGRRLGPAVSRKVYRVLCFSDDSAYVRV
eukprot:TRINITY_DN39118_c0_g1_i3.p1 TRINITY_DN39118_c0_g1~~TRINITY_DN39118_c0_g1_i3.p1  ORF type:complete len:259 (+),score=29.60 TRINITY_DN39118_c0_g1_i3:1-777(+)